MQRKREFVNQNIILKKITGKMHGEVKKWENRSEGDNSASVYMPKRKACTCASSDIQKNVHS